MKAVLQRVSSASVMVDAEIISSIYKGLIVFIGIEDADTIDDIKWLSNKIINLRIFDDADLVPNLSIKETAGDLILVSQFTLHASTKKGNRPSYLKASKGPKAFPIYVNLIAQLEIELGKKIQVGKFGADMKVALVNDGPMTIIIDTKNKE